MMLKIPRKDRKDLVIVVYPVVADWWERTWNESELDTRFSKN
jgi:hypothetical protein